MKYRPALLPDAERITLLNHRYHQAYVDGIRHEGFLTNSFSLEQIVAIIEAKEIVVAESEGMVVGYYLTSSIYQTLHIKEREKIINALVVSGSLPVGRYVYITQAVVDSPFMKKGVAKEMLKHLKKIVYTKYDYLVGFINEENLNARVAHVKSGWKIVTSVTNGCLAVTPTS